MKIGTRSVLYGAHAFWLHPWFVAWGWWKLYGFPWDPRLWLAFFVHDLGYWGRPNMDGPEGELHPFGGARLMGRLIPRWWGGDSAAVPFSSKRAVPEAREEFAPAGKWPELVLWHSRFLAKRFNMQPSRLCVADKLAIALTPWWLYLPMVVGTGEIAEYMALARDSEAKYGRERRRRRDFRNRREWCRRMQDYCRTWALEHQDGRTDTWTPDQRVARDASGVWE